MIGGFWVPAGRNEGERMERLDLLMIQWTGDKDNRRESDHSGEDEPKANVRDQRVKEKGRFNGPGCREKRAKKGEEVNAHCDREK